jgi:hypothetical protein
MTFAGLPSSLGQRDTGPAVSPRRPGPDPERAGACARSSLLTSGGVSASPAFSPLSGQRIGAAPSAAIINNRDDGGGCRCARPAFTAALDPSGMVPDRRAMMAPLTTLRTQEAKDYGLQTLCKQPKLSPASAGAFPRGIA